VLALVETDKADVADLVILITEVIVYMNMLILLLMI